MFPRNLVTTSSCCFVLVSWFLSKECGCEIIAKRKLESVSMIVTVVSRSSGIINRMGRGNSTSADGCRRERLVY